MELAEFDGARRGLGVWPVVAADGVPAGAQPSGQVAGLLHAAALADLDPGQVLADAIGEPDLAGSRDIPSVIDARLSNCLGSPVRACPGSQVVLIRPPSMR